jgi:hypothetical protein
MTKTNKCEIKGCNSKAYFEVNGKKVCNDCTQELSFYGCKIKEL